jgi:hypothetical protein
MHLHRDSTTRDTNSENPLWLRWEEGASSTGHAACTAAGKGAIALAGQSSFPCGRLSIDKWLSRNDRPFITSPSLPQSNDNYAHRETVHFRCKLCPMPPSQSRFLASETIAKPSNRKPIRPKEQLQVFTYDFSLLRSITHFVSTYSTHAPAKQVSACVQPRLLALNCKQLTLLCFETIVLVLTTTHVARLGMTRTESALQCIGRHFILIIWIAFRFLIFSFPLVE